MQLERMQDNGTRIYQCSITIICHCFVCCSNINFFPRQREINKLLNENGAESCTVRHKHVLVVQCSLDVLFLLRFCRRSLFVFEMSLELKTDKKNVIIMLSINQKNVNFYFIIIELVIF